MRRPLAERVRQGPEWRGHDPVNIKRRPHGQTTVDIRCPFCSQVSRSVAVTLLSQGGKRCTGCGAIHMAGGQTRAPHQKKRKGVRA